jgi:hypothetical protein
MEGYKLKSYAFLMSTEVASRICVSNVFYVFLIRALRFQLRACSFP